jgi:hypothetical protein
MSSLDVAAPATSARIPAPPRAREVLLDGPIVAVSIPRSAYAGHYENDQVSIHYLQFPFAVRGGLVNCYLHTDDETLRGRTVVARATVAKKIFEDGRQFLYIDLKPVDRETEVTHRLAILSYKLALDAYPDWTVLRTLRPIDGMIIFAPPDAKIVDAPHVMNDNQLRRLLVEGWRVAHLSDQVIKLFRMKGDVRKEMTHHRPCAQKKHARR